MTQTNFLKLAHKRYATKDFDPKKLITSEQLTQLKEAIKLSCSSFGLQPYTIKIVQDKAVQAKLQAASWNQPQVGNASHVLVFCANSNVEGQIDKMAKLVPNEAYIGMMRGFAKNLNAEQKVTWAQKQVYLAVANALHQAVDLGFDACPMEGFDPKAYSDILKLPSHLTPTVVVPIGFATDKPRPKIRFDDLFI